MIAFVQYFGLLDAGGGSRILRALLEDAPEPFVSVCTSAHGPRELSPGNEIHLPVRPHFGRIESTRLNRYLNRALSALKLEKRFLRQFEERLEAVFREQNVTAVHAIPHGLDFWVAFRVADRMGLPYFVSIHDDLRYNLRESPNLPRALEWLGHVWSHANGRTVISDAMGEEYCRRYGRRDYEVITDGLTEPIREIPRVRSADRCRMYFLGAMHLTFHENVHALEDALYRMHEQDGAGEVAMILRGSKMPVHDARIAVDERPFSSEEIVQQDFDDADILYIPLPFGEEYAPFRQYSMSTKLVTYLGTGLPILYHGPADAAAAKLLSEYDAAVQVNTLDADAIISGVRQVQERRSELATNALTLARERFLLRDQRERFWQTLARDATTDSQRHYTPILSEEQGKVRS